MRGYERSLKGPSHAEAFEEKNPDNVCMGAVTIKRGLDTCANEVDSVAEPEDWIIVTNTTVR